MPTDHPTPAEAIPGGVAHPDTPTPADAAPPPAPDAEPSGRPEPEPDPRDARIADLEAELTHIREEHNGAAIEADELRGQAAEDARRAEAEQVIAGYSLPPFAADAARAAAPFVDLDALCRNLAEAATPRPLFGRGGLDPTAPAKPDHQAIAERLLRQAW
ncbi:hypothetical protein OG455_07755 [Kitasatospora sp. NBC_01287]|uniref:hypothetical protein n=1 Tax=Kitasatospora sp. NBC_01287 TaxID=2903573 RepID=UPI00224E1D83|nr:hypothetical protein [Kitasatospora sp. NBC_01287]MCX4745415.1 hypothetical protein [Kitasatospora sp. NBC_01287]